MIDNEKLNSKIKSASKWTVLTELLSKLVTPITSMVLVRILTPEAFGIVATLTMIITFAEIFTDAGFQKYLIQHEFIDDKDREESTTVAFWSNLVMSFLIWGLIAVINEPMAELVGNPGLGYVIVIACVSIPLAAFSSIQMALYKRDFDFKTLFKVRMVGILIPLIITIPLAFIFKNFWALLIGTISRDIVNAILLTSFSTWKPRFYFSFAKLKEMLSFTIWSMFEAISLWLGGYVDVFFVGTVLSQYYLGLYKTSSALVGSIMAIITATSTPILFSSLSRLQNDREIFERLFLKFQHLVAILIIPMGVGIFCYSDLVTNILLGNQWTEASGFIGLWGLTSAITIVLGHYSSEVYRALGKPKLSTLSQWLHIIVLWPTVIISVKYGFEVLYISRSLIRFEGTVVNLALMYFFVKISPQKMIKNIAYPLLASLCMMVVAYFTKSIYSGIIWSLVSVLICAMVYSVIIFLSADDRKMLLNLMQKKK